MRNRQIRNRGRRRPRKVFDIDITSLLDILVILLVFLLKSYNSSGIILNVPKGITLPGSQSLKENTMGVVIQVSPDMIWVDDQEVLDRKNETKQDYDMYDERRIVPLFNKLVELKNTIKEVERSSPEAKW